MGCDSPFWPSWKHWALGVDPILHHFDGAADGCARAGSRPYPVINDVPGSHVDNALGRVIEGFAGIQLPRVEVGLLPVPLIQISAIIFLLGFVGVLGQYRSR